ncbi:Maf family protein [Rubrivirga sp.]|uniref:Maf family protein n=1 Tax=Rubrivirga sp. TaxID=1885344 RepID=UPI003C77A346
MISLRAPLILASASPRRKALLESLGLEFEVRATDADETWPENVEIGRAAETVAMRKARALEATSSIVLAADTVVVLDGEVLGKPADDLEAGDTLRRLRGRTHSVVTAMALRYGGRETSDHVTTRVTFADLEDAEIDAYVSTGSPLDKAGSYGIQDDMGALLVDRIEGDYFNVVGLPLRRFYTLLKAFVPDLVTST